MKNKVSEGSYYYWHKTIREDSLLQAGTLAITGGTEFAELSKKPLEAKKKSQGVCAVIHLKKSILSFIIVQIAILSFIQGQKQEFTFNLRYK